MSINEKQYNSILNTFLSWLNRMAFDDLDKKYKECNGIEKIIYEVERYYSRYKTLKVPQVEADRMSDKLRKSQLFFEDYITIKENGKPIIEDNGDIRTIEYSLQYLSIVALDHLINVENDLILRSKFGHIDFKFIHFELEKENAELYYSMLKLFDGMVRETK